MRIMIKNLIGLFLLVFLASATLVAQHTVTGKVIDSAGLPIPGVNVFEKENMSNGTITNFDGDYTLEVANAEGTLSFSFIGFQGLDEVIAGRSEVNVTLTEEVTGLDEVVVTALGIKREKKTLTYSSQEVSGEEMMKSKDVNFMSSLSGKTAGLEIKKSTSGAGGSTRTVLRGSKSVGQLSEPLYVIDGVPMVNRKTSQGGIWGGTDGGDGLSQINPDDIESINVLKGATASILYGSQGANGVVIITTKQGKAGKTSVSVSSSTTFESVMETPDLQFKYGARGNSNQSWATTAGNYEDNYVDDFFRTGYNTINNISVSSGTDKLTTYFSYGNTSAGGIIPNNHYNKHNFSFKQVAKIFDDKVTLTSNIMLTNEKTKNRSTAGYYYNPLTGLYMFPRDGAAPSRDVSLGKQPFSYYKNNYSYFDEERAMILQEWHDYDSGFQSNPYWLLKKQPREDVTNRVIASLSADYKITDKLSFKVRGNYDYAVKTYDQRYYAGGNPVNISRTGKWDYQHFTDRQAYTDGIFTYQNDFGNVSLGVIAGASYQVSILQDGIIAINPDAAGMDLIKPNIFALYNMAPTSIIKNSYGGKIIKEGAFANVQLGYKDMLFLDLSGRNDWSSTLATTGNESYFYPAVGVTGILSQMVDLPDWVTFAKVRGSGSQVNNDVPFGQMVQNSENDGTGLLVKNTRKPWKKGKPEQLVTYEVGTSWRFLESRLGIDFTYYDITSTRQALERTLPTDEQVGGFTSEYFNAGKITNKGIEVILDATPVKTGALTWKTAFNFALNRNKVVEFYPGDPDRFKNIGSADGYVSRITTGGSIGDLYVYKHIKNEQGQLLLNDDGTFRKTRDPELGGSINPDFTLGWNNSIDYKNWSFNFLVNSAFGGNAFSQTESMLDGYGVSQRSADARDRGYVAVNAVMPDGTAVTQMNPETYYKSIGGREGVSEHYLYDRTNIRLAQLALSYKFDTQKLGLPFVQSASLSVVGNNLFFIYKDAPFDPEMSMSTGLGSQSVDNFNLPSTRTYGFNLKLTF